jgi:hypothetical protein
MVGTIIESSLSYLQLCAFLRSLKIGRGMGLRTSTLVAIALLAGMWLEDRFDFGAYGPWVGAGPRPVRILQFYATVGFVESGETAQLCYSVENAKSVEISPLLPGVYLSKGRCVEVVPDHTTNYTIMALGYDGATAYRSLTLPVRRSEPSSEGGNYVARVKRVAPIGAP